MNIELKNIKFSESLSEETNAFTADVYVNGKKLLYAKNSGQGGSTDYNLHNHGVLADEALLKEVEDYCKALPAYKDLDMDLEFKIDLLLEEWLNAKQDAKNAKRVEKDCLKGLVYKTEKGVSLISWKGHTIASMLQHPQGKMALQSAIKKIWKDGYSLLNKNIPAELL